MYFPHSPSLRNFGEVGNLGKVPSIPVFVHAPLVPVFVFHAEETGVPAVVTFGESHLLDSWLKYDRHPGQTCSTSRALTKASCVG